jgi:hypothetical protein
MIPSGLSFRARFRTHAPLQLLLLAIAVQLPAEPPGIPSIRVFVAQAQYVVAEARPPEVLAVLATSLKNRRPIQSCLISPAAIAHIGVEPQIDLLLDRWIGVSSDKGIRCGAGATATFAWPPAGSDPRCRG